MKISTIILAIIISCSLSYGQYGKDFEDMSQTEKMMMYNSHKKNPMTGVLYSWFFPSLGHAYANNWKRGTYFLVGEAISIIGGMMLYEITECYDNPNSGQTCNRPYEDIGPYITIIVTPIIYIWEKVDAYKEVKRYNRRIYKDIFGKEPPSFSLNLQPTYQGANLTLAYKFD